jgi:hypothetical protein
MFGVLCIRSEPYYAGHYRGEDFPCLRACNVMFGNWVGTFPALVTDTMKELSEAIGAGVSRFDAKLDAPDTDWAVELLHLGSVNE